MTTLQEFVEQHNITSDWRTATREETPELDGFFKRRYLVTLRFDGRAATFPFGTGGEAPDFTPEELLYSLISDARGVRGRTTFRQWCDDYDMRPTQAARHVWEQVHQQRSQLVELLGQGTYRKALNVELD